MRLAVLIGGGGSALQALIDAERGRAYSNTPLQATVAVVVSHRAEAGGLRRALGARVAAVYLPPPVGRRRTPAAVAAYEERLVEVLRAFAVDLVVLAGWMLIFTPRFLDAFPGAVVNIHPALLPDDGGETVLLADGRTLPAFRGAHAVEDALAAGVDVTGATVHYVVPAVDAGPVLRRAEVPVLPGDTVEALHARIKEVEHRLLLEALTDLDRG
jgi:phosphoribosylglycinamide formyltransferase-1